MRRTLHWALETYRERRAAFERMQKRGMRRDWSWDGPVREYVALYEGALGKARG